MEDIHTISGLAPLKCSITAEYALVKYYLPSVYFSYFHIHLNNLLSKSAQYLKRWFLVVRSARESCSITTCLDELFSNGSLRVWVELSTID